MDYEKLLNLLTKYLQKILLKYAEIDSIILFGSYAKKTYTKESDIDLCVLLKRKAPIDLEDKIFEHLLDLEKEIDKTIQCVFISHENLENWDRIFVENILAEGQLLCGTTNYQKIFINRLELDPYYIITLNLRNLSKSDKMKLKRALYGYRTEKTYLNKTYSYQKGGILQKLKGFQLGRGSFVIPERLFYLVEKELLNFNLKYSFKRIWIQRI